MVTTTFHQPDNPFQDADEVCQSCKDFWKSQQLTPRRMVSVGKYTENRNIEIVVCPHCDGNSILRLGK